MEISQTLHVTTREAWRAWLEQNHDRESEIWLIFYKKHSGQPRLPYDDAVEEALCFGWIDSTLKRMDDEKYAQKFTPRRNTNKWSELNKRRATRMIQTGRMTPAGLAKLGDALATQPGVETGSGGRKRPLELPKDLQQTLMTNPVAWENFNRLAPSHRRNYVGWILDAKRDETRQRRLQEAIQLLAQNKKLGMK